jgi:hypothetical protein
MRWLAAFLTAFALCSAAQARSPEALACAIKAAPPELDARLADVVLAADPDKDKPTTDALHTLVDRCADDQFLNAKERTAYFDYTLGRMARYRAGQCQQSRRESDRRRPPPRLHRIGRGRQRSGQSHASGLGADQRVDRRYRANDDRPARFRLSGHFPAFKPFMHSFAGPACSCACSRCRVR